MLRAWQTGKSSLHGCWMLGQNWSSTPGQTPSPSFGGGAPNGFTTPIQEMDVRPGGLWNFIMHCPDGTDYPNQCIFPEIARPARLVYSPISGPSFQMNVTFEKQGSKTNLTMRMLFESATERNNTIEKFGAVEGARQTLGRLAAYLANAAT